MWQLLVAFDLLVLLLWQWKCYTTLVTCAFVICLIWMPSSLGLTGFAHRYPMPMLQLLFNQSHRVYIFHTISQSLVVCTHTNTHTHARTHTRTLTRTHTHTHTHAHAHTHTYRHTYTHTHTSTHTQTCKHTNVADKRNFDA